MGNGIFPARVFRVGAALAHTEIPVRFGTREARLSAARASYGIRRQRSKGSRVSGERNRYRKDRKARWRWCLRGAAHKGNNERRCARLNTIGWYSAEDPQSIVKFRDA